VRLIRAKSAVVIISPYRFYGKGFFRAIIAGMDYLIVIPGVGFGKVGYAKLAGIILNWPALKIIRNQT
jgi:hypothetical protein